MRRSTVHQRLTCFTSSYILYKANHLTLPSSSPLHTNLNANIHVCCDVSLRERVMIRIAGDDKIAGNDGCWA